MKYNPRRLFDEYNGLIWSALFFSVLGLWGLLFAIAVLYGLFQ